MRKTGLQVFLNLTAIYQKREEMQKSLGIIEDEIENGRKSLPFAILKEQLDKINKEVRDLETECLLTEDEAEAPKNPFGSDF